MEKRGPNNIVTLSKYLSYLLRHGAAKEGLTLGADGYARVSDILALPQARRNHYTLDQVKECVEGNDKQRFALKVENEIYYIRANQGHSDKSVTNLEMTPIKSADALSNGIAVHGTYFDAWKTIKTQGLKPMSRNHIHFALGEMNADEVVSGMRRSAEVMIFLNVEKVLADGIPLFLSANGVVLSPGNKDNVIGPAYFLAVVRTRDRKPFDGAFPALPPKMRPRTDEKEEKVERPIVGGTPIGGNPSVGGAQKKTAPEPSAEAKGSPQPASPANRRRNLERRLKQIEELKAKKASGTALNADQLAKMEGESATRAEIATLPNASE